MITISLPEHVTVPKHVTQWWNDTLIDAVGLPECPTELIWFPNKRNLSCYTIKQNLSCYKIERNYYILHPHHSFIHYFLHFVDIFVIHSRSSKSRTSSLSPNIFIASQQRYHYFSWIKSHHHISTSSCITSSHINQHALDSTRFR